MVLVGSAYRRFMSDVGKGTAGQLVRATATGTGYTTATFPSTAGTSGNILTSDGTNWTSATNTAGAGLQAVTVNLTSAQIKAIHGTPITVVPAQGANTIIMVVSAVARSFYGGTNVFVAGAAQEIVLYYSTLEEITNSFIGNAMITAAADRYAGYGIDPSTSLSTQPLTDYDNRPITLYNPVVTEITGNAANNNTMRVQVIYWVASFA